MKIGSWVKSAAVPHPPAQMICISIAMAALDLGKKEDFWTTRTVRSMFLSLESATDTRVRLAKIHTRFGMHYGLKVIDEFLAYLFARNILIKRSCFTC
jgi:hypothetical protein